MAITDSNKQMVKNTETGQTLRNDILCRPTDKELLKIYKKIRNQNEIFNCD